MFRYTRDTNIIERSIKFYQINKKLQQQQQHISYGRSNSIINIDKHQKYSILEAPKLILMLFLTL